MATGITTDNLVEKCRMFVTSNANEQSLNHIIKEAILKADSDIRNCDSFGPLAWHRHYYDGLKSNIRCEISAITQASPGVITADSVDSDITGHGFDNHTTIRDIVLVDGIAGMTELNTRLALLEYASATTFSLKTLDGLGAINTTNYTEYDSGGHVYHAGFVLNTTTILTNVSSEWGFKRVIPSPTFDGHPTTPISESQVRNNKDWLDISSASRPKRWRHWHNMTDPNTPTVSHYLFWYPVADQEYEISFPYEREIPDISTWDDSTYPFHPPEVHPALWHGALAHMAGLAERMKRQNEKSVVIRMEVMFAQKWQMEFQNDLNKIRNLNRDMLGSRGGMGGLTA